MIIPLIPVKLYKLPVIFNNLDEEQMLKLQKKLKENSISISSEILTNKNFTLISCLFCTI